MEIVLASSNKHKVQEINDIVKSLKLSYELNFILPPQNFDPIENGNSFEENSYIKAYEAWKLTKKWTLADDSGLCIDFLNGKPGIFSARYAETPELRIKKVLEEMKSAKNRDAHFACSMTVINPQGEIAFKYQGICEGSINFQPKGNNGFGYDPIFLLKNDTRTMAELSEEEKNKVSHRFKALIKTIEFFNTIV